MSGHRKTAVIIGAGPAGLTAALELLRRTDIVPVILEASHETGGISRTVRYKGYRMDIGGHRFFSKSDRVMNWWLEIFPVSTDHPEHLTIAYHGMRRELDVQPAGGDPEKVMLIRNRKSRIFYLGRFFSYPVKLSSETLMNLGMLRTMRILASYLKARLRPIPEEVSLEDFMINRFGKELYLTFFKDYTEKVWGKSCHDIPAEWGAQRIKGVSISQAIHHAIRQLSKRKQSDIGQKDTETSLIEKFLYPKYGPGQLWEEVAQQITARGGRIIYGAMVSGIDTDGKRVKSVLADTADGALSLDADYCISTMPVKELIAAMTPAAPQEVQEIAAGLEYRDFITVGLLLSKLDIEARTGQPVTDNWIYIQEGSVKLGRLQVFNNWSPHLVEDPDKIWLGLEYFCNETDELWQMPDDELLAFASKELESIGFIRKEDVLDGTVIRVPKTYPAYFGTYNRFDVIRRFTDGIENLYLIGRNGMHKYNNQDHSMLTAMTAVDNIIQGVDARENLWQINTEMEYHEEKKS